MRGGLFPPPACEAVAPMTRLLSLLLLLGQLPVLAAEPPAPPVFDPQGRTLGPPLSERVTDYEIDARLDPTTHALTGQETITWREDRPPRYVYRLV